MSEQARTTVDHPDTTRVEQPGREEGIVRHGAQPVQHERPEDWGWHGAPGRWGRVGAWVSVLILVSLMIGTHEGRVEDLWVVGVAAIMVIILLADIRRRRNAWRAN